MRCSTSRDAGIHASSASAAGASGSAVAATKSSSGCRLAVAPRPRAGHARDHERHGDRQERVDPDVLPEQRAHAGQDSRRGKRPREAARAHACVCVCARVRIRGAVNIVEKDERRQNRAEAADQGRRHRRREQRQPRQPDDRHAPAQHGPQRRGQPSGDREDEQRDDRLQQHPGVPLDDELDAEQLEQAGDQVERAGRIDRPEVAIRQLPRHDAHRAVKLDPLVIERSARDTSRGR